MDKLSRNVNLSVSLYRGARLAIHIFYGMLLAIFYPHLGRGRQNGILKKWSRQLLAILNIGIQIEGQQAPLGKGGCLIVANHISWLDIFVLNAIRPTRFVAKSEVRGWPVIGWLCKRAGTIFIERAQRQNAAATNKHICLLLEQDICVGLFPEGTSTDGRQVGHFHSSLFQPAIDAGAMLHPIALRYQDKAGRPSAAAAYTGEMTLVQSICRILQCGQFNALVAFNPALVAAGENRRVLARTAQESISRALQNMPCSGMIHLALFPAHERIHEQLHEHIHEQIGA